MHFVALCESHYSLGLICNDWLSSTSRAQIGALIDYTQTNKKNPVVQHKILIMRNYLHSTLHFSPISLTLIPVIYISTPSSPSEEYAIDQACMCEISCARVHVFVWVVDGQLWATVFTYWPCSYWLRSGDPYPSCVGNPSTLTGLLYHQSSQALTSDSH